MKLVCLSDTHNNPVKVPDGDVLIFAGDWGCSLEIGQSYKELLFFKDWFERLPHKHKIVVAGNHDTFVEKYPAESFDILSEKFTYLEHTSVEINGLKFFGSPYTPLFGPWAFMRSRGKTIKKLWSQIPDDIDVLITHGPPFGKLDMNLSNIRCGCEQLMNRVEDIKPKIHIFGHIHPGHGISQNENTIFVNCSICQDDPQRVEFEPIVLEPDF